MPARLLALLVCCLAVVTSGCDKLSSLTNSEPEHAVADTIYTGTLITMDRDHPSAEAVAVKDGRIVAVGTQAAVMKHKAANTNVRELGDGVVMLPGFIDAHSHFMTAVDVSGADTQAAIAAVQLDYARNGFTTVTSGTTSWKAYRNLQKAADNNRLLLDIIAIADFSDLNAFVKGGVDVSGTEYDKRLRVGGVKLVVDQAPETKMAYFSIPMLLADGPNGEKGWRGEPAMSTDALDAAVATIIKQNAPIFAEAHGDAAIDMIIGSLRANGVVEEQDRRDTILHSQFLRPADHVSQYKRFGVVPSFCSNRIYQSGDDYMQTVGGKRVNGISPIKSAYYVKASNHTDYPETALSPMMMLWTSVNRLTASGKVLEEWQRLDVNTALSTITIDAAWQFHEDGEKGSIAVGKVADFVILDESPLTADPVMLKDIQIMETIKGDKTVYRMDHTIVQ